MFCPPTTTMVRTGEPWAKMRSCSAIWLASSRVGARTRAATPRGSTGTTPFFPRLSSLDTRGTPNAIVFPVPVWASPITSTPPSAMGMASRWIGVGSVRPILVRLRRTCSGRPRSEKLTPDTFRVCLGAAEAAVGVIDLVGATRPVIFGSGSVRPNMASNSISRFFGLLSGELRRITRPTTGATSSSIFATGGSSSSTASAASTSSTTSSNDAVDSRWISSAFRPDTFDPCSRSRPLSSTTVRLDRSLVSADRRVGVGNLVTWRAAAENDDLAGGAKEWEA
mmetsp:Transcript_21043/g.60310  ORF Transcript_21043/g.60310 Transcript_21043/m.60310 type:complete len:281 (+) Transcript_21043:1204-2046(+)